MISDEACAYICQVEIEFGHLDNEGISGEPRVKFGEYADGIRKLQGLLYVARIKLEIGKRLQSAAACILTIFARPVINRFR